MNFFDVEQMKDCTIKFDALITIVGGKNRFIVVEEDVRIVEDEVTGV